jgi:imidazoleglycerol-phosphate dehydratase
MRIATINRKTKETDISLRLNIDGEGKSIINTGIGFLDHMLTSFAFHGKFDLEIKCTGDLKVDDHHTVEDIGIVLGQAFNKAFEKKIGIKRFASMSIPMDESLATVNVDISNRAFLVYNVIFENQKIGTMEAQNFKEFFKAFVNESKMTLHINLIYGENDHHKIEAVFKAFAKAIKEASLIKGERIESSKGVF